MFNCLATFIDLCLPDSQSIPVFIDIDNISFFKNVDDFLDITNNLYCYCWQ